MHQFHEVNIILTKGTSKISSLSFQYILETVWKVVVFITNSVHESLLLVVTSIVTIILLDYYSTMMLNIPLLKIEEYTSVDTFLNAKP